MNDPLSMRNGECQHDETTQHSSLKTHPSLAHHKALRFKDNQGNAFPDWCEKKLGEVGDLVTGLTYSPTDIADTGILVLRSSNVQDGKVVFDDNVFVTSKVNDWNLSQPNDILICVRNGSKRLIGKNALIPEDCPLATHGAFMTVLRSVQNPFIYQLLQTDVYKRNVYINLGATINSINGNALKKFKFMFPTLPEQAKIASFLTSVDDRIDQLKRKKSLLQDYKKGVMQRIFSQQLRFKDQDGNNYPDWQEKKLGEVCKITTGRLDANAMKEDGEYRFYTCAKSFYMIDVYAFDTEALLISGNGANVGYIHYYRGKFNAYQRTYVLDGFDQNITFIKYQLQSKLKDQIDREKKAGNTPYIVMGTLTDMKLVAPTLPEQTKIANFLTAIDQKIEQVSTQITETENFKKGLLQQMFV